MAMARVTEWIEIKAPRQQVFELILNVEKRMQLSPLWGLARVACTSDDYPSKGSVYVVEVQPQPAETPDDGQAAPAATEPQHVETLITECTPPRKLAYKAGGEGQTNITWTLQDTLEGTRVTYSEEFPVDDESREAFCTQVREVVKEWLQNLQRYAQLGDGMLDRTIRWFLDRHYLRMRPDQRRTVSTVLFMHAVGMVSFVMAALAWGVAMFITH